MSITGFDITAAAESYSAVAALVAGFAFAVLVWVVEQRASDRTDAQDDEFLDEALVFLALAFVGNVLTAFMWALISGEAEAGTQRTSMLSFLSGWIFSMLVPLTMQAMVYVTATTHSQRVIDLFRRIFFASALIGLMFQWTSTVGYVATRDTQVAIVAGHPILFYVVAPISVLIIVTAGFRSRGERSIRGLLSDTTSFDRFVSAWLVAAVLVAIGFGYISVGPLDAIIPLWVVGGLSLYWSLQVGWGILFLPS